MIRIDDSAGGDGRLGFVRGWVGSRFRDLLPAIEQGVWAIGSWCSGQDPLFEFIDVLGGRLLRVLGRHFRGVDTEGSTQDERIIGFTWDQGRAGVATGQDGLEAVQLKVGFMVAGVMASDAVFHQDRFDGRRVGIFWFLREGHR